MSKLIGLKNTTLTDIELTEIGETVPVSIGSPELILDLSLLPAISFRKIQSLETLIMVGDIVVFDGINDLLPGEGYQYIVDDVTADQDGFWYYNRRRFGFKLNTVAHGYVPGETLYIDDLGVIRLADATLLTKSATSFVVTEIIDVDNFYAAGFGAVCIPDTTALDDGLPMITGRSYFLSIKNPGKMTTVLPIKNNEIVKLIGLATSPTDLLVFNYPGYSNKTK